MVSTLFKICLIFFFTGMGGQKARSSGGERYLDAVEVWGSNPHVPTIETNLLKSDT